jgi:uncharacterized membrane protein YkvA (DUF1232 family)
MPLNVSFVLSDRDLRYFRRKMREATSGAKSRDEASVIASTRDLLVEIRDSEVPDFVSERIAKLGVMVSMLEDKEWKLAGADRKNVLNAMAYFAEAEDLIPDAIPGIGFLDDAIMVELVVQELRHEIDAYGDFVKFREVQEKVHGAKEDALTREEWMAGRRTQLHSRMRRRRRGRRSRDRGHGGDKVPFRLW